ncbi:MAG TPA: hypothetical protein DCS55_20040 [Acidimicrobiaceae bacterium]|nr:hypothetical protein [Acidimicrobiaceae bacterium]
MAMRTRPVRRGIRTAIVLAAVAMAAGACSSEGASPPSSGGQTFQGLRGVAPVALQSDRSCGEVLEDFQSFAPAVLSDQMFGFAEGGAATTSGVDDATDMAVEDSAERVAAPDEAGAQLEAADGSSSDTNTQEAGIDEPDVVENDGEFVYVVDHGPDQAHLVILDGATAEVLSRTPLASYGAQLLLQGDRMLVVTSGGYGYPMPMPIEDGAAVSGPAPDEEPIPVDPFPMPTEPPTFAAGTVLQLLDVTDRRAPQVVQTTEIEGHHVSTRVVDGVARVVVSSYPDAQPLFDDVAVRMGGGGDADSGLAAMEAGVADMTIEDWLPAFRTTVADEGDVATRTSTEGSLVACEDVFVPEVNAGIAQTSVLRVDFADGFDPADTTTVVAEAGTVYASTSTLYVAANTYVPLQEQGRVVGEDFTTALHAFDLRGDGPAAHLGAGAIPGHLLNQYSLSEHDGYLRVATTEGAPWGGGEDSQSGVRVLRLEGGALVEVGAVTGLGVTETIQSVRFMGPVGYVVTFRQTDPLYVIDLSDPTAPAAVGELKIPGFSSYLHPVGEGRLVGIGRDADLEGRDQGLLVSLFDVADPTAPAQLQTWIQRDAWSVAGDDPKAFLHWSPESAVVVPLERFGEGTPESGMVVLDVADSGITERALVTAEGRYPSRALVVQGRLWSLFDGGVVVSDFANPTDGVFTGFR